ncbi:MAG: D-glycerate dehydrogenase [Candidatus Nomurabacteria bacterium]|nr:D-glycerate dehydrogenase [Candidatus Nomurabacteria bacterium]
MNKKIFITRKIPDLGITLLKNKGYEVDVYSKNRIMPQKELISILKKKDYDAVLCLLTDKIDAKVYDAAPNTKLYANYATGFDNLDLVEAKKRGITITNAPADLSSEAVAEHALAMILALAARIVEADDFVRRGKYKGWDPMNFIGTDTVGKTLGLVGAGRIGERVAIFVKGLGMKVIYTDVNKNPRIEESAGAEYCKTLEELLPRADIVSLHVPLLDSTKHLMNEKTFKLMKKSAYLVNTSRGPIVDEKALVKALKEKVIAGAGLDVFEFEPKLMSGLAKLENVILTPHIGSASIEARNQMAEVAVNNIIDFFEGKLPKNVVNK